MNITDNTFKDLAQVYRDLLFLLNKAVDIVELQPLNEFLQLNGMRRITEVTISNLDELIKNTRIYYEELKVFYEKELFRKPVYNFSYLESFPDYRKQAINGLRVLNERILTSDNNDRIIISNFINYQLNSINELLLIVRDSLRDSSVDLPFRDYIERFQLQDIERNEIIAQSEDGISHHPIS